MGQVVEIHWIIYSNENNSLCSKTHYKDRSLFKAEEILKLATIEGAKVLKMDEKIGSLEVGKKRILF